jgi:hypothetical protein
MIGKPLLAIKSAHKVGHSNKKYQWAYQDALSE